MCEFCKALEDEREAVRYIADYEDEVKRWTIVNDSVELLTEVLKECYEILSKKYGYFCTDITREENDDENYELTFTWTGVGPIRSFTYSFTIDDEPSNDEVAIEYDHGTIGIYSADELTIISDFVYWFNHARNDKKALLRFIDWLDEEVKR